jgi:tetratricopeptide (TPR) repeat protein
MNAKPNGVSRSKFAICLLSFAICLGVQRAEARSNAAVQAFNEGVKLFNAKQFSEAIPLFDDAISSDDEFVEAYFARGACKYYLKSMDGALMDLNDALRLKSDDLDARALRGAVNYESDRWDAALEDFNYVLDKNPHDAQSLLGRAVILLKREDMAGAEKDFKGFLRVRPDDPLAPKVRQLLASLKRSKQPPPAEGETASSPNEEAPPAARHAPASTAPALSSEELQRLADGLLAHPLAESYDRKVLRGENAQAVGDIHSVPGVPTEQKPQDDAPQIIEPQ